MSLSAAVLDALVDAGATREQIIAAVKADIAEREAAAVEKLESKRAGNRERQQRKRINESRDVTPVTRDTCDPAPNERDILTPTRETKTEPKGSSKSLVEVEKREAIVSCLKVAFVLPGDIPSAPWAGFEEMRKRIRKPMTDNARALAVTELRRLRDEEGWPPGDVLDHCTMNSYQGIYPPTRKRNVSGIGKSAAAFAALNPGDEPF